MRTEIHLFGGLGGYMTIKGIRTMEMIIDKLPYEADAQSHLHGSWEKVKEGIVARFMRWGAPDLVILGGHSWGCKRTVEIANYLKSAGLVVDYVFGIDPTLLPTGLPAMVMPSNVRHVDEFHATSGVVQRGRRFNHGGKYVFRDDWAGTRTLMIVAGGHIPCAKNPNTQNRIKNRIEGLLGELD